MSKSLESQVWHSALGADLKPVAAVMADMGNQDGLGIYPSVEYIAWLLSCSERSVQRALAKLVKIGILDRVANAKGGRGLTPRYRLNADALPERPKWQSVRKGGDLSPFTEEAKGCHSRPERVTSTTQKGDKLAPDPLVDPLEIRENTRARGTGYKTDPKPSEEKWFYPPPDFPITEILYLWLAEMCFTFSDSELTDATNAWRESRASKPHHFKRTLGMWQADWQKFIRAYWQIRQRDKERKTGYREQPYTGPVQSVPDPVKENCPDCRGSGTVHQVIDGVTYGMACKHQGKVRAA